MAGWTARPSIRGAVARYWFIAVLGVEILLSLTLALDRVWHSRLELDEGFYLTAGSHVFEGQVPYRDFPFFQGPLSAYVYGISQWAVGPGILAGRATSFVLFVISLLAGIRLAWLYGGRVGALLFPFLFVLSPLGLYTLLTVRTYPLSTTLLLLLSLSLSERIPDSWKWSLAILLSALAFLTRVSMFPLFLGVVAFAAHRMRHRPNFLWGFAYAGIAIGVATLFFASRIGWDRLYFNLVESQLRRDTQWAVAFNTAPEISLRSIVTGAMRGFHEFPVPFLAGLFGLSYLAWNRSGGLFRSVGTNVASPLYLHTLLALGWTAYLPQLVTRVVFPHYFVPSAAVLSAFAAGVVGSLWSRRRLRRIVFPLGASLVFLQWAAYYTGDWWSEHPPPFDALRSTAEVVRSVTPENERVFTLDLTVTVEAHRNTPDELAMGPWSYWRTLDHEEASRLGVVRTDSIWWLLLRSNVSTVVLTDFSLGVLLKGTMFGCVAQPLSEQELKWAIPELSRFDLVEVTTLPEFGPTYILRKAKAPAEPPRLPVGWVRPRCEDLATRSPYRP